MNVGKLNSYFGEGTVLKGVLKFKGLLRFDGEFEGDVRSSDTFIVGETGKVRANIKAGHLYNFGAVKGDVDAAGKISLHAGSSLEGNIKTPVLMTEEMAVFQGSCYMPPSERKSAGKASARGDEAPLPAPRLETVSAEGPRGSRGPGAASKAAAVLFLLMTAGGVVWFTGGGDLIKNFYLNDATARGVATPGAAETDSAESPAASVEPSPSGQNEPQAAEQEERTSEKQKLLEKIESNPDDPAPRLELARLLLERKEYKEALGALEEAVEAIPGDVEIRTLLARTYHKTGREDKALEQFRRVVKADPESMEAKSNEAFQRLEIGALRDAEAGFKNVLAKDPGNHRARLGLATVYSKMEMNGKAIEECRRILEEDPDYAPALNRLAWIYSKQEENLDEAERMSRRSMAVFDDIPQYIDTLSEINYQKGDYDRAVELIRRAIALAPGDSYYERQLFKFQRAQRRG
ncbi:MAG: tetratricopeptide repeat protein [Candidatus Nitrospinota bacterium M3_3B_026]